MWVFAKCLEFPDHWAREYIENLKNTSEIISYFHEFIIGIRLDEKLLSQS